MKKILSIAFVTLLVVSCKKDSSKVDQDKIFQEISCRYDAELNKTYVEVQFHEDNASGKALELSGSSNVTINGTQVDITVSAYSREFDGLITNIPIVFTDGNGKTFTNTVSPESAVSNDSDYYISKSTASSYIFGGSTVASGEVVSVKFTNNAESSSTATISQNQVGAGHIALTVSNMAGINLGVCSAVTTRTSTTSSGNFTSVGGTIKSVYSSTKSTKEIY